MGFLSFDGEPLSWEETKKYADHVREHGITQFIHIYERLKDHNGHNLKWGDEIEYALLHFDHERKKVQLVLRGEKICEKLMEKAEKDPTNSNSSWGKEYGRYMVEGLPGKPYGGLMAHFNTVEANMALRAGCGSFTVPEYEIKDLDNNPLSRSLFFPDEAITSHPRFTLLTKNIRERRGKKVVINVPIFKDENTPSPFVEEFGDPEANAASKPDHIYMDAMGFGMGDPCLQATFQAYDLEEAQHLYDELASITPIMLALSAGSPVFRGYLSDIDVRWYVIAASVDDRTDEEMGLSPLKHNKHVIRKSRFDSIDSYLSNGHDIYNDVNLEVNESIKKRLADAGVDELLAQHMAHIFIRDPMTLFSKRINLDDAQEFDHFEVDENMQEAAKNDAARKSQFWFRREIQKLPNGCSPGGPCDESDKNPTIARDKCYKKMSIDTIINGKADEFVGFIPLIRHYLNSVDVDIHTRCSISEYLKLISKRASGEYLTTAQWMREFIRSHPDYKKDSVVSDTVTYDLLWRCCQITSGEVEEKRLFTKPNNKSVYSMPPGTMRHNPDC